jgi:hypothetical protein
MHIMAGFVEIAQIRFNVTKGAKCDIADTHGKAKLPLVQLVVGKPVRVWRRRVVASDFGTVIIAIEVSPSSAAIF